MAADTDEARNARREKLVDLVQQTLAEHCDDMVMQMAAIGEVASLGMLDLFLVGEGVVATNFMTILLNQYHRMNAASTETGGLNPPPSRH